MDRGNAIDAGERRRVAGGGERTFGRQIGAEIGCRGDAERQDAALGVEGELAEAHVVAAHVVAEERLAALAHPLDGTAELARRPQHQHMLRIERVLGTEAAADVADDDADPVVGQVEHRMGEIMLQPVRHLRHGVERQPSAGGIVEAEGAARFHRRDHDAVVDHLEARHAGRAGKARLGAGPVAAFPDERGVARRQVPDLRRVRRECRRGADRCRQRIVVDHDQLGGVLGEVAALRHHQHHGLADIAHPLAGERRKLRPRDGAVADAGDAEGQRVELAGDAADAVGGEILAGEDAEHARCLPRRCYVDCENTGVGVRRAHEMGVNFAGLATVIDEVSAPHEKARVLLAPDRLAKAEFAHNSARFQVLLDVFSTSNLARAAWLGVEPCGSRTAGRRRGFAPRCVPLA